MAGGRLIREAKVKICMPVAGVIELVIDVCTKTSDIGVKLEKINVILATIINQNRNLYWIYRYS